MSNLYEDVTAQGWLAQAFNALTMDSLWTRQLRTEHMTPREMHDTADLGESLLHSWRNLTNKGALKELDDYLRRNAHGTADVSRSDDVEAMLSAIGGFDNLTHVIVHRLGQISGAEAASLMQKIDSLRSATWTPGDLSPLARCLLLAAACIVALCLHQGEVGGFLAGWFMASGCPNLLLQITESEA
ncbi:hypothetical protein [Streptomyces sp. NPDC057257]|uniref:hypothetical protein n=1 Tax=Streptomyces sp. NPDC057257 TaxID=3346071 RepID=UPI003627760D